MTYIAAKIDVSGMQDFGKLLAQEASGQGGGTGFIRRGLDAAGLVYMGFIRNRYDQYSQGAGDWPPLSPFTIARKKAKAKSNPDAGVTAAIFAAQGINAAPRILIETGQLIASITNFATESIAAGIRVGTAVHYAEYHQDGLGVPQRMIFVEPDDTTTGLMAQAIARGYQMAVDSFSGD